jgi:hypothetical protein
MSTNIEKITKLARHLKSIKGGVDDAERKRKQAEEQPRDEEGRFIATDPSWEHAKSQPVSRSDHNPTEHGWTEAEELLLEDIERELGLKKSDRNSISAEIKAQAGRQILEHKQVMKVSIPDSEINMYASYKHNPHHRNSGVLKYLIHRVENIDSYRTPDGAKAADADFLKRRQQAMKLAHVHGYDAESQHDIHYLHNLVFKAPHLIDGLLKHQEKLHNYLKNRQEKAKTGLAIDRTIKNINGEPHVALFRGLKNGERKPDPLISSYSDTKQSLGGRVEKHHAHWVPLKNVWYSYDLGPSEAHPSHRFPAQDEYIVSPHDLKTAHSHEVNKMVPQKKQRLAASESLTQAESLKKADVLEKGIHGDWSKEGYSLGHEYDEWGHLTVFATHPSEKMRVGSVFIPTSFMRPDHLISASTNVLQRHQRKGLATAMYQYAEKLTGKKMAPSNIRTEAGQSLWSGGQNKEGEKKFGKSLAKSDSADGQFFVDFPEHNHNRVKAKGGWATWHFSKADLAHILRNWDKSAFWERRGDFKREVKKDEVHPSVRARKEVTAPIAQHIEEHKDKVKSLLYHGAGQDKISADALKNNISGEVDAYDPFQKVGHKNDVWQRDITALPSKQYDQVHSHYTLNVVNKNIGKQVIQEIHDRLNDNGKAVISVRRDDICRQKPQQKLVETDKLAKSKLFFPYLPLAKAFKKGALNLIKMNHHEPATHLFDNSGHFGTSTADPEYISAATDKGVNAQELDPEGIETKNDSDDYSHTKDMGVSPKLLHNIGSTPKKQKTYMTKPYHREPEDWDLHRTIMPIMGWSTVTNHALYNAGNIGHLCEKIQTHTLNGIHVTVHPFEKGVKEPAWHGAPFSYGTHEHMDQIPKEAVLATQQIAVMDFLTHNTDRHGANILYRDKTKMPVAIDHERSFQYRHEKAMSPVETYNNMSHHILGYRTDGNREEYFKKHGQKDLYHWWNQNRDNIVKELQKHAGYIKSDTARNHIVSNFMNRVAAMDKWALTGGKHDLFSGDTYMGSDYEVEHKDMDVPKYADEFDALKAEAVEKKFKGARGMAPAPKKPLISSAAQEHIDHAKNNLKLGHLDAMNYGLFVENNPEITGALKFYFDEAKRKGVKDNGEALYLAKKKLPPKLLAAKDIKVDKKQVKKKQMAMAKKRVKAKAK